MPSLNLGDLQVGVKVAGADKAKQDLKGVQEAAKGVDSHSNNASSGISGLTKAFKDGIGNASVFGVKLGDLGGALGSGAGMTSLMQGAVAGLAMALVNLAVQAVQQAIAALVEFGKQSIKVASDLEESANVVEVVFGKENKIVKWAEENAQAFNLSALEAEKFAGTMGAMLTPSKLGKDVIEDMSITLTKLSGDLGSLWNTTNEEAFNALRSAMAGESEPMRKFGVVMLESSLNAYALSQGISKTTQEMNEAEKAILRYNYLLENTATAQGDASRTAGGYANASKQLELAFNNAKAAFGEGFLPALSKVSKHISEWINSNLETIKLFGKVIGNFLESGIEYIKIATAPLKWLMQAINWLSGKINNLLDGMRDMSNNLLSSVTNSGKKAGEAITYSMQDMASATKGAMSETVSIVEQAFGNMKDSATREINGISEAYKNFFNNQMRDYEKQLREQFNGGTLAEEKKIQKKLSLHAEFIKRKLEKDEEYYKQAAKFQEKYRIVTTTNGNSTSISYVPRNANGTLSFSGGLTRMNEIGPELTFLPGKAQIINNHETKEMFNNIADNSDVVQEIVGLRTEMREIKKVIQMLPSEQQMLVRGGVLA